MSRFGVPHRVSEAENAYIFKTKASTELFCISQTQQYFGVSAYLVKKARELKASDGILADPMLKKGKALAPSTVDAVLAFFEDDEISRPCPGKKDFVSVKMHGKREQKQKRLTLGNLNEMYAQFKERHPQLKIGISKFCELRPKWCVTVGARGIHSVCVCTIHQNPKLMLAAIGGLKMDLHQVMELVVWSTAEKQCMLMKCP